MVLGVYDSFLDADAWPDDAERGHLATLFGWPMPIPANPVDEKRHAEGTQ